MVRAHPTDDDLLVSGDPEDFGRFYDRYVRSLLAFFQRRTGASCAPRAATAGSRSAASRR
jgi:hypothetical protein